MPCLRGEARHPLCKSHNCPEDDCPCVSRSSAYSCRPTHNIQHSKSSDCPKEAFGRILTDDSLAEVFGLTGVTGFPGVLPNASNQGIADVIGVTGSTGEYEIIFKKNFFDTCPDALSPIISVTPCRIYSDAYDISNIQCTEVTPESARVQITSIIIDPLTVTPTDLSVFDFRAIQSSTSYKCH